MKILIVYTGTINSDLNNKFQELSANPNNLVELYKIQCFQDNQLPSTDTIFSDFDEIIVYLTDDMNDCPYLEFLLRQAARYSIPITVIYASDYQTNGMPDWASKYANKVITIGNVSTIDDLLNSEAIYQTPDGQVSHTTKTKRHC